jgi:hypothetical protein
MVEDLGAEGGVGDGPVAKTRSTDAGADIPELDIAAGTTLVLSYPGKDKSIGPQPFREDDVKKAMEDVNVRDVIKDKET